MLLCFCLTFVPFVVSFHLDKVLYSEQAECVVAHSG